MIWCRLQCGDWVLWYDPNVKPGAVGYCDEHEAESVVQEVRASRPPRKRTVFQLTFAGMTVGQWLFYLILPLLAAAVIASVVLS